eukprot:GHVU01093611.1.p1 GENE.GHVU01093611.1~~GHVU01093611.1.p1  ORF type:complete len:153 (-),score=1.89 GHVU01093611.1:112-570(-)
MNPKASIGGTAWSLAIQALGGISKERHPISHRCRCTGEHRHLRAPAAYLNLWLKARRYNGRASLNIYFAADKPVKTCSHFNLFWNVHVLHLQVAVLSVENWAEADQFTIVVEHRVESEVGKSHDDGLQQRNDLSIFRGYLVCVRFLLRDGCR